MLQNLSERIRLCYERAAKARQQAEETNDPKAKADFLNTERRWLLLARSYQHSESLTDFVHAIPDRSPAREWTAPSALVAHKRCALLRTICKRF
jgi:hypothetical protein